MDHDVLFTNNDISVEGETSNTEATNIHETVRPHETISTHEAIINTDSSVTEVQHCDDAPFALVLGKAFNNLPKDLYIPPHALKIILEAFQGPLDLLLYLIRRQNLDILEINVAEITHQYVTYVEMMDSLQFELAAEYLVMAAMLAEIKSRMLLPRTSDEDQEEEDPRLALIKRLQEYERFKYAADELDALPRLERDIVPITIETISRSDQSIQHVQVDIKDIVLAMSEVLKRAEQFDSHHIHKEPLSTRERMTQVLDRLNQNNVFTPFVSFLNPKDGRMGVIVTFMAILELIKESLVEIIQSDTFGVIHIKARSL